MTDADSWEDPATPPDVLASRPFEPPEDPSASEPSPMSSTPTTPTAIPTATITVAGKPRQVRFDFARLVAIETGTGLTVTEIVLEIMGYFDGMTAGQEPTDAQKTAASKKMRTSLVIQLVAATLGVSVEDLGESVQMDQLMDAFKAVVPALIESVNQLGGAKGGAEGNAAALAASAGSAPGPVSSSG